MSEEQKNLVGYARVSTLDQDPQMQIDALERYGVSREKILFEKASGKTMDRPVLTNTLRAMGPGSTLVVWKLDRLGRTVLGVLETVELLHRREIGLVSVTDAIDTHTAAGRFNLTILAAVAELERNLIAERTAEGMRRKMADGTWKPGRTAIIPNSPKMLKAFQTLYDNGDYLAMTNAQVYEVLRKADPSKKFTQRTYVKWKHDGHPGALLNREPSIEIEED